MKRGFTLVELTICLSIAAILVPVIYQLHSTLVERGELARWQLETADAVATVGEELRACGALELDDEVLYTAGSCPRRALARGVSELTVLPSGVEVRFVRRLRPGVEHARPVFFPVVP